jgi:hypothetical protein
MPKEENTVYLDDGQIDEVVASLMDMRAGAIDCVRLDVPGRLDPDVLLVRVRDESAVPSAN